jgi:hypothetical protein
MATYSEPKAITAARVSLIDSVAVRQTASFASANGDGYYEFSNGTGGELSYEVPADRKAFLSWLSVQGGPTTTWHAVVAFYLDGALTTLRVAVPAGGTFVDLTNVAGLGTGYIAAASVIKLMINPSDLTTDVDAAFGVWLE